MRKFLLRGRLVCSHAGWTWAGDYDCDIEFEVEDVKVISLWPEERRV